MQLDDRLAHFQEYQEKQNDKYGAEVLYRAREEIKRLTKRCSELSDANMGYYMRERRKASDAISDRIQDMEWVLRLLQDTPHFSSYLITEVKKYIKSLKAKHLESTYYGD